MDNENKEHGVIMPSNTETVAQTTETGTSQTVQEPAKEATAQVAPATDASTTATTGTQQGANTVTDQMITPPASKKKVNNKIVLLALLVLVIFGGGYYFMGKSKMPMVNNNPNNGNPEGNAEANIIKIETGSKWADEYSVQLQKYYDTFDAVDVTFIDLNFDDTPEMIVKYTEDKKENIQIFYFTEKTNSVTSTKAFPNSDIELIYSLYDGKSRFYLHIKNTDKYGTYTEAPRLIAGTVYKVDIEATNDKAVTDFKEHYVVSDYKLTYYEVKKDSFEENFKTILERKDRYASEISEARDKLEEENEDRVEKIVDDKDSLESANFKLVYGKYLPDENRITDGSINDNIYLNNDGTLKIGSKEYRFDLQTNYLILDDGTRFKIIGNDSFMIEDNGGIIYRAENPINMTAAEIDNLEKENREAEEARRNEEKRKQEERENGLVS